MPLHRRVPKRGFYNPFSKDIHKVNVRDLNRFDDGSVVGPDELIASGLIKKAGDGVKILGTGTLEKKLTVKAHAFSQAAADKISAAGGSIESL